MYEETPYEEYMRSVLGYCPTYARQDFFANQDPYIMPMQDNLMMEQNPYEQWYPEIYYKIYPVICRECQNVNMPFDKESLEKMTETVLQKIELDLKVEVKHNRQPEDRQFSNNNQLLRDLIRILILRQIIGGGNVPRPPHRPPFPGSGPRPPFPGPRPPFPGGPGPIRPREM